MCSVAGLRVRVSEHSCVRVCARCACACVHVCARVCLPHCFLMRGCEHVEYLGAQQRFFSVRCCYCCYCCCCCSCCCYYCNFVYWRLWGLAPTSPAQACARHLTFHQMCPKKRKTIPWQTIFAWSSPSTMLEAEPCTGVLAPERYRPCRTGEQSSVLEWTKQHTIRLQSVPCLLTKFQVWEGIEHSFLQLYLRRIFSNCLWFMHK